MAPKETKAAATAKTAAPAKKDAPAKTDKVVKKEKKSAKSSLADGVRSFSKDKVKKRQLTAVKSGKKADKPKIAIYVVKKIGGANNGGERKVLLRKNKSYLPTKRFVRKRSAKRYFRNHKRYTRKSLKPGKVLILLAGRHKGKRVVLLKVLKTGLLLVTGPFLLNGCPLRRIAQNYVIATKTRVDLKKYSVPKHINDRYFKRQVPQKERRKAEVDIFAKKEFKYLLTEQRKADQKAVDEVVLKAIKEHQDGKLVLRYLKSMFSLRSNQYPHRMKF